MSQKKPLIFISPLSESLAKLKEVLYENYEDSEYEIYECEDMSEALQTSLTVGASLILISHPKKSAQLLKAVGKKLVRLSSKVILLTPKKIPPKTLDKMHKIGLTECIVEPIAPKSLLYKVNFFIRSLPLPKAKEDDEVVSFKRTDDSENSDSNEAQRVEKGIMAGGLEGDEESSSKPGKNISLYEEENQKNNSELDIETNYDDLYARKKKRNELDINPFEEEKRKKLDLNIEEDIYAKKKSELDISFDDDPYEKEKKSIGEDYERKKEKKLGLDILESEEEDKRKIDLLLADHDEVPRKHAELNLDTVEEELEAKQKEIEKEKEESKKAASLDLENIEKEKNKSSLDLENNNEEKEKSKLDLESIEENEKKKKELDLQNNSEDKERKKLDIESIELEKERKNIDLSNQDKDEKERKKLDLASNENEKNRNELDLDNLEEDEKKKSELNLGQEEEEEKKKKDLDLESFDNGKKEKKDLDLSPLDDLKKKKELNLQDKDKKNKEIDREEREEDEKNREKNKSLNLSNDSNLKKEHEERNEKESKEKDKKGTLNLADTDNLNRKNKSQAELDLEKEKDIHLKFDGPTKDIQREMRGDEIDDNWDYKKDRKDSSDDTKNKSEEESIKLFDGLKVEHGIDYSEFKKEYLDSVYTGQGKKSINDVGIDLSSNIENELNNKLAQIESELDEEKLEVEIDDDSLFEGEHVFEAKANHLENLIYILNYYRIKDKKEEDIIVEINKIIEFHFNCKCCFVLYDVSKKKYFDFLVSENFDEWEKIRKSNLATWTELKTPFWKDETFQEEKNEFIFPFFEGSFNMGFCFIQMNQKIEEEQAPGLEVLIESSRGLYLEKCYFPNMEKYESKKVSKGVVKETFGFFKKLVQKLVG